MAQVVPHDTASDVDVIEDPENGNEEPSYEGEYIEDGVVYDDEIEYDVNQLLNRNFIIRDIERFFQHLDYSYLKQSMEWLLITARVGFSLSFEDTTMYMTLYVLFADNILYLSAPKFMGKYIIYLSNVA